MGRPEDNLGVTQLGITPSFPVVALLVTCLVDVMRPQVAFASYELLERAGARVFVPPRQTCCGQIAYNAGNRGLAADIAEQVMESFADADYIVAPSGSCIGMLKMHFPTLLKDRKDAQILRCFSEKCWELTDFLVTVMKWDERCATLAPTPKRLQKIAYHDSCSGLRELKISEQPRKLLKSVGYGGDLNELCRYDQGRCCGFGGSFCVTCPDVSVKMADDKIDAVHDLKADSLVAGDLGCLMHLSGRMSYRNRLLEVYHVAELLADAIAERSSTPMIATLSPHS